MKTIEEKAKAYDDAFERAKQIRNGNPSSGTAIVVCEQIFPELRESEDERIREALIEEFTNQEHVISWWGGVKIKDILAYLEKKKEVQLGDKDRYMEGYMNGMNDALKEQKPLSPDEKMNHPLYLEGFDVGREVGKVEAEQKPAEWSEEDKLNTCPHYSDGYGCDISPMKKCESCEHRPSWKPSEEQMRALEVIVTYGDKECTHIKSICDLYNDLKKL